MDDRQIADGLALMCAFFKIADASDRRKVIELAPTLARASSHRIAEPGPIAPR